MDPDDTAEPEQDEPEIAPETPVPSETPEGGEAAAAFDITPTPAPIDMNDDAGANDSDTQSENGNNEEAGGNAGAYALSMPWPVWAVLIAAVTASGAWIWRRQIWKHRIREFMQPDLNAAAIAAARYAVRMLHTAGCPPIRPLQTPEGYVAAVTKAFPQVDGACLNELLDMAQRARFSDHVCTKRERDAAVAFVGTLPGTIAGYLPRLRRWFFRWRYPTIDRKK